MVWKLPVSGPWRVTADYTQIVIGSFLVGFADILGDAPAAGSLSANEIALETELMPTFAIQTTPDPDP